MNFLLPAALSALAALLLPVLIHLSRRSESQRVEFAALRWLQSRLRPRRRPVLEERLLLLIRLLLLALLALLLAQPVRFGKTEPAHWLLVAPGVDRRALPAFASDHTLQRHWLAPGFPAMDAGAAPTGAVPLASLLREWDAAQPATTALTVLVPARVQGLDAQRLRLSRQVDWRVVAGTMPAAAAAKPAVPPLAVSAEAGSDAAAYFRAAYAVWQDGQNTAPRKRPHAVAPGAVAAREALWLYLRRGALPDPVQHWVREGGTLMVGRDTPLPAGAGDALWRNADGDILLRALPLGRGRILQWVRPLQAQAMPELAAADFPQRLAQALLPETRRPESALAADHPPLTGAAAPLPSPQPLAPWLAIAVAALFALERGMAGGQSRWKKP